MENTLITWQNFKDLLTKHSEKHLQFQYGENNLIDASYHITEIKLSPVTSVDCGGKINNWTEVIIQLWEPSEKTTESAMKVSKALSIFELAEGAVSMDADAIIKIEFGNSGFDTRQMYPDQFIESENSLIVSLIPELTRCKASKRSGNDEPIGSCCAPSSEKPDFKIKSSSLSSCC